MLLVQTQCAIYSIIITKFFTDKNEPRQHCMCNTPLRFSNTSKRIMRFLIISTNLPQEYYASTLKSVTVTSFCFIQQSIIIEDFCTVTDTPASCLGCLGFKLLHNEQPSWMRMSVTFSVSSAVQDGTGSIFYNALSTTAVTQILLHWKPASAVNLHFTFPLQIK